MNASSLSHKIEELTNDHVIEQSSLGGGCIANTQKIRLSSGRKLCCKTISSGISMFTQEANGLRELAKTSTIRIPEVLYANDEMLVMEYIETGHRSKDFFKEFGRQFAEMHLVQQEGIGFYEDNFIGANPQINTPLSKVTTPSLSAWCEFYFQKRILYQLHLSERKGYVTKELSKAVSQIENLLFKILEGSEEPASVLHGDLWSGNFIIDENGSPCLIDPAVYYGHREADLAMTRLFGGFNDEFYSSYQKRYPLKEGWQDREAIYKLYHVFNHLNLFGHSYYGQTLQILQHYNNIYS